jgi:ankyrin repeat protein
MSPGMKVHSFELSTRKWLLKRVLKRCTHRYQGDMVTVHMGQIAIRATGNHPFYVLQGDRLDSRPLPQDVPKQEQPMGGDGRWVEARDLREGDVLLNRNGEESIVTGISIRVESTEGYDVEIEDTHNYAVHRTGILVHNKAGQEQFSEPQSLVTVYGRIPLEHYEVSVLGAAKGAPLLEWLLRNGYAVDPAAEEVLDAYIEGDWSLVAARLNPGEKRRYDNEFLPPLTIAFRHDRLVFPLRISSLSTDHTAKITLYLTAESTVESSNFRTEDLDYEKDLGIPVAPEIYLDACIQKTLGSSSRAMAVTWSGEFAPSADEWETISELIDRPFPQDSRTYLTRLETRIDAESMTEDVELLLHHRPNEFHAQIQSEGRWWAEASVEAPEEQGVTELMHAALDSRRPGWVISSLRAGAHVDAQDSLGATALMYAARYNRNPGVISALLEAGAAVDTVNRHGWSALFYAAGNPNSKVISTLLEAGAEVDRRDRSGLSTLMHAATEGNSAAVRTLLEAGADVNAATESLWTALILAANGGHAEVVKILVEAEADVNAGTSTYNRTALLAAARAGHTETVRILLQAGAHVDVRNWFGRTALTEAAQGGHAEVVRELLEAGAEVNAMSGNGTALAWAAGSGHREVVKMLLEAGAGMNAGDGTVGTALMSAAKEGHAEIARLVLERGADANARDRDGKTALWWAAFLGYTEMVGMLLEAGADVNAQNKDGYSVLMNAAFDGHTEVVRILLRAGADVGVRAKYGTTALMRARTNHHTDIIELLKSAGAKK